MNIKILIDAQYNEIDQVMALRKELTDEVSSWLDDIGIQVKYIDISLKPLPRTPKKGIGHNYN
jgi:hypothetical protein